MERIRVGQKSKGTLSHPVVDLQFPATDPWITRHGRNHLNMTSQ